MKNASQIGMEKFRLTAAKTNRQPRLVWLGEQSLRVDGDWYPVLTSNHETLLEKNDV